MELNIEKIQRELDRLGWSKYILAQKMKVTKETIYSIFRRNSTKISTINQIAEILDVDPKDLLIWKEFTIIETAHRPGCRQW